MKHELGSPPCLSLISIELTDNEEVPQPYFSSPLHLKHELLAYDHKITMHISKTPPYKYVHK